MLAGWDLHITYTFLLPNLDTPMRVGSACKHQPLWGSWVAQSVKRLTSVQVMISLLLGLSSVPGSVLTAQSLEPALDSVSPSLSLCPSLAHALSLSGSLSKIINIKKNPKPGRLGGAVG